MLRSSHDGRSARSARTRFRPFGASCCATRIRRPADVRRLKLSWQESQPTNYKRFQALCPYSTKPPSLGITCQNAGVCATYTPSYTLYKCMDLTVPCMNTIVLVKINNVLIAFQQMLHCYMCTDPMVGLFTTYLPGVQGLPANADPAALPRKQRRPPRRPAGRAPATSGCHPRRGDGADGVERWKRRTKERQWHRRPVIAHCVIVNKKPQVVY